MISKQHLTIDTTNLTSSPLTLQCIAYSETTKRVNTDNSYFGFHYYYKYSTYGVLVTQIDSCLGLCSPSWSVRILITGLFFLFWSVLGFFLFSFFAEFAVQTLSELKNKKPKKNNLRSRQGSWVVKALC